MFKLKWSIANTVLITFVMLMLECSCFIIVYNTVCDREGVIRESRVIQETIMLELSYQFSITHDYAR